ncbi:peptidase M19 [Anopheles sinensis]|uniref:Peptidase M19 n=1 Tax=Anopheles sinensis TaxID=74873 RepID=A0A084W3T2_ANOSI|nr:peptidase M19 [Anopheles sinensis]
MASNSGRFGRRILSLSFAVRKWLDGASKVNMTEKRGLEIPKNRPVSGHQNLRGKRLGPRGLARMKRASAVDGVGFVGESKPHGSTE